MASTCRAGDSRGHVVIGTAGWAIPKVTAPLVAATGSHLERYASAFNGVEINSSFYRAHAFTTYARWARETPASFRFAVKMPTTITLLAEASGLGVKRCRPSRRLRHEQVLAIIVTDVTTKVDGPAAGCGAEPVAAGGGVALPGAPAPPGT